MNSLTPFTMVLLLAAMLTAGCKSSLDSKGALMQWINDPGNGLVKSRTISGIELKAKYLPPEYLAIRDLSKARCITTQDFDVAVDRYDSSLTFLLSFGPSEDGNDVDIMLADLNNEAEFKSRTFDLNFGIVEYVTLRTDNYEVKPVLANLENVYGLTNHRNIYLVFAPDAGSESLLDSEEFVLVFEDEYFNTGITKFSFSRAQLTEIPELKFLEGKS